MEGQVIENRIKDILKGNKFIALKEMVDTITDDTSLLSDLVLDSIQILELILAIEKEFGFSCEPDELNLDMFDRFGSLKEFVNDKVD